MFQDRTLIGLKDKDPQKFPSFHCKNSDNMAQNRMENNFKLAKQLSLLMKVQSLTVFPEYNTNS